MQLQESIDKAEAVKLTNSKVEMQFKKNAYPKLTLAEWFKKYFLQGQDLNDEKLCDNLATDSAFDQFVFVKYRKFFAVLLPFLVAQCVWWSCAIKNDYFKLYSTHWEMPITMIFGAIIAGMTSEGGGAVAFPVMTFILKITPTIARDFALMIQTTGMSMALLVIVLMNIVIEWRAVIFGLIGGVPGLLFGLYIIDPIIEASVKKMFFVSFWCSFAISLWILNSKKKRFTVNLIMHFNFYKAVPLIIGGFVGGLFTSFAGSGIDICIFSMLTLLFRVTEKTATPTTVVLMALLSQIGFYWRAVIMNNVSQLAWTYLKVCAPVVVTFAPLGSFLGSHFHRKTLAYLIYILEFLSYIGFLLHPNLVLIVISILILVIGYFFFQFISHCGEKMILQ